MNPEHQLQSKESIILGRKMCPQEASTNIGRRHRLPQDLKKKRGWGEATGGKITILNTFLHMSEIK